jgi:DNA-binding winged helix-turn-helix (wHTH) protein/tetratricopeptide (TPR) repeat protein
MTQSRENSTVTPAQLAFDGWTLDRLTGELCKGDIRLRLQEQPLQLLDELLARPGELVTREHLIGRLWPKGVVDFDTGLNTAVRKLRLALGDDSNQPRYIETLPRKGYRFIGKLESSSPVPQPDVAPGVPLRAEPRHRKVGVRALWLAGMALIVCAAALVTAQLVKAPASPNARSSLALQLYMAAAARQPEIFVMEGREPRERVLELVGRSLAIDPSLAPAYVVRARANLDFFISNLDVSDELLAAVGKDLDTARQLSGNDRIGLDVRALYAAVVDLDPEKALRMTEQAPDDPDVLQSRAIVLMTLGRYRESDEIFGRFLALDPGNLRLLRIKISNLLVERRAGDALELIAREKTLGRTPRGSSYSFTGEVDFPMLPFSQMQASLNEAGPDGEQLLALWPQLAQMRIAGRFDEIRALLDTVRADSSRVPVFTGALPGIGRHPVAVLRGWNDMLRGDAAAAAASGRDVREFLSRQRVTKWNSWHLQMLEAQAQLFMGRKTEAVAAVMDCLNASSPLLNRHMQVYRDWLAAVTLAWAGEQDRSVTLVEKLATGVPGLGPLYIARDPLVTLPLKGNARFEKLKKTLEMEIRANAAPGISESAHALKSQHEMS